MADPATGPEQPGVGAPAKVRGKLAHEYSDLFLAARELYPKRDGTNSWHDAWLQWRARVGQGEDELVMLAGTKRYARWCAARGRTGSEFVMQARRFFGRSKHYLEDWTVIEVPDRPDPTIPVFTTPHHRHK